MSTFAKSSFNAAAYAASRPTYPPSLYQYALNYATAKPSSYVTSRQKGESYMLDIGCGPGLSTFELIPHFDNVIGIDPSPNMVSAAKTIARDRSLDEKKVTFEVGQGEHLSSIRDDQIDLVIAAQAAHWFDAPKVYSELNRILKPGGSFVFWGYGECYFPDHPKLSELIPLYSGGTLGKYWQQPGRSIVEALLSPFPFPSSGDKWLSSSFKRTYFRKSQNPPSSAVKDDEAEIDYEPLMLKHNWNLKEIEAYLRTWSSAHSYNEQHKGTDVVETMVSKLQDKMKEEGLNANQKIVIAWDVGMVMGKKVA